MYVASDHKDWDTYLPSATCAFNTSLSKTTDDTLFFLTYGREPVKLPVALLPPLMRSNSVDYHRVQSIRQISTAGQLATECTQQTQQRLKLYYDQHAKDHPFRVGHKVWIYNPATKPGLSKKLCSLWHDPFLLIEQITPVFKVANLQGKLQKDPILVNRMKQYFTYDEPPIDPPPQNNFKENSPNPAPGPQTLFRESPGTGDMELVDGILPNNSRHTTSDHVEDLQEINTLPDLTESQQQQLKIEDVQDIDNQLDTTTLPNFPEKLPTRYYCFNQFLGDFEILGW